MSLFKPIFFEMGLPDLGKKPTNKFDCNSYWWVHEQIHRMIQTDYRYNMGIFLKSKNEVQKKIIDHTNWIINLYMSKKVGKEELFSLTKWAFDEEENLIKNFRNKISVRTTLYPTYCINLKRVNSKAGIKV